MRYPESRLFASSRLILGVLIGVAVGEVALADYEDLATIPAAPATTPEAVAEPVPTPKAVAVPLTGSQVYTAVCIACHAAPGVGGAPALGDGDAWAARIAQGKDTLIAHALQGFSGRTGIMPKKGGSIELSDEETIAAVEYMVQQVTQ